MAKGPKADGNKTRKVTRYTHDDVKEPRTPETGHTSLLPAEEQVVTLPMDNGWTKAIDVGKLPDDDRPVVVDMDPAVDPRPLLGRKAEQARDSNSPPPAQRDRF